METPLSARRITRSQTKAISSWNNNEESQQKGNKSTKKSNQRRSLIDITNGSPIVGLANMSDETCSPSKLCTKTPGSGEALLRGQVKTLLQKVEEVADISKFLSFDTVAGGRHGLKAFLNSPAALLAPTPANTPQIFNLNHEFDSLESVLESPIEDQLTVSKVVNGKIDGSENEKDIISRSLFLNFSDKSKDDDEEEDDDASIWSIQVNASTQDEDEEKDVEIETKSEQIDDICEGMKNIRVEDEGVKLMGKHTRFEYNSEDEIVVEEEVLHLKGIPTPKGKHLRFQDEDDE